MNYVYDYVNFNGSDMGNTNKKRWSFYTTIHRRKHTVQFIFFLIAKIYRRGGNEMYKFTQKINASTQLYEWLTDEPTIKNIPQINMFDLWLN